MANPDLARIFAAFPRRPLTLRPPSAPLTGRLATMAGWLFFIGIAVASLVWVWPAVQSDWQVKDSAVPVRGASVSGKCHSKLIFHICDVSLAIPPPRPVAPARPFGVPQPLDPTNRPVTRDVTYMFVDFHFGAYEMEVMADPRHPALLTTDLALDKFYNRAMSLFAAWAFMLAGAVISARLAWRSSHVFNAIAASSGQVLAPVAMRLVSQTKGRRNVTWTVSDESGAQTEWTLPAAAAPFLVGGYTVLGIAGPSGAAMPLDAALTWIDLTDAERAAIFAAQSDHIAAARAEEAAFRMDHPG